MLANNKDKQTIPLIDGVSGVQVGLHLEGALWWQIVEGTNKVHREKSSTEEGREVSLEKQLSTDRQATKTHTHAQALRAVQDSNFAKLAQQISYSLALSLSLSCAHYYCNYFCY